MKPNYKKDTRIVDGHVYEVYVDPLQDKPNLEVTLDQKPDSTKIDAKVGERGSFKVELSAQVEGDLKRIHDLDAVDTLIDILRDEALAEKNLHMIRYAQMAKRFMNKPFRSPLDIVGNYDWHEAFPYEKFLFHDWNSFELLVPKESKVADFGCGPGRMINRAQTIFKQVDGIDISEYAIDYARQHFTNSQFFVSSGIDVGGVPENTYDLIFSTIAIQHIPCKTIRQNIFRGIYNSLKPGGYMSIQVAYHPTMTAGVWSADTEHASYDSDFWNAKATNGHADMVINKNDLPTLEADLFEIFDAMPEFKLEDVAGKYANLNGKYHAPYWAQDWLFIQVRKGQ